MSDSSCPALLVVEDDDSLRESVSFVLSAQGYKIVSVSSGEEAFSLIAEIGTFDGLYTDINLSGLVDGWEVGIAFSRRWPAKPIVYASAREWRNARVMPTGVFLRKPFNLKQLIAVLAGRALAPSGSMRAGAPGLLQRRMP
jgi:two-component system OmpR family response regulator